jgi:hypothetical protein
MLQAQIGAHTFIEGMFVQNHEEKRMSRNRL